jgi:hypothetical protein
MSSLWANLLSSTRFRIDGFPPKMINGIGMHFAYWANGERSVAQNLKP